MHPHVPIQRKHSSGLGRRFGIGSGIVAILLLSGMRLHAEESKEYQVKAGFLFRFTSFIEWPPGAFADAKGPIIICIFGDDPFGREFDAAVQGEMVRGRTITIKRTKNIDDLDKSQIVFIGSSERHRIADVLKKVKDKSIVTVGETESFLRLGGILRFFINEDGKVRFEIHRGAARRAGLKISSELLKVARVIDDETQ